MSQSKELTPLDNKVMTIGRYLQTPAFQKQLGMAMPFGEPSRMARMVLNEVRKNPKLADCSIESLLGVAMACAQTGLEPGPTGLAYVIPYGRDAHFQLGYKGTLNLSWRSEGIIGVASEVVKENDPLFEWDEGSDAVVRFQRLLSGERGVPIAVFAAIKTKGGGNIVRVMSVEEIEKHRKQYSKDTRDDAAWVTAWDEQACKTVLKKALKRAPVSTEVMRAMEWDGLAEAGKPQRLEMEVTVAEPMIMVKCPNCDKRDEYPIPFEGACTAGCANIITVPPDAEADPETNEMLPPRER